MFADNGFDDILYGYPLSKHHMDRNYALAERIENYHVMINSVESAQCLIGHEPPKHKKWYTVNQLTIISDYYNNLGPFS